MIPSISQLTTLSSDFLTDFATYERAGFPACELWLTKLEMALESHGLDAVKRRMQTSPVKAITAAGQSGLLLAVEPQRSESFAHYERRLDLLETLGATTLVLATDHPATADRATFAAAVLALGEVADLAAARGIRIALEFHRASRLCSCLETALILADQVDRPNVGVCLDLFHFALGPSRYEDLNTLNLGPNARKIFNVQVSDVSGVIRELAQDADRILPGDGDIPVQAVLTQLASLGYAGPVTLELANPELWRSPADRLVALGFDAVQRVRPAPAPTTSA